MFDLQLKQIEELFDVTGGISRDKALDLLKTAREMFIQLELFQEDMISGLDALYDKKTTI